MSKEFWIALVVIAAILVGIVMVTDHNKSTNLINHWSSNQSC